MANLGFIGLGIMGKPMAGRLVAAGHDVSLHSRSGVPHELIEKGGRPVECVSLANSVASTTRSTACAKNPALVTRPTANATASSASSDSSGR